jgi:O-antigen/teichoic acid export membrane protein
MSAEPQHLADVNESARAMPVAANVRQLSIAQLLKRATRILGVFIAARLLGVDRFGVYALILTVTELIAVLSGAGYVDFLTREIAKNPSLARALTSRVILLRLTYIIPFVVSAASLLWLLRFPGATVSSVVFLCISLLPRVFGESAQGLLKGCGRFSPLPWAELLQGIVLVGAVYVLLAAGWGIHGAIVAEIASAAAGSILLVIAAYPLAAPSNRGSVAVRDLIKATWPFSIFPFIGNLYDRADVVVLSKLAGNFATGVYAIPYRIYASFQIIPASVMGAWLPVFSASEKQNAASKCRAVMKMLLLTTLAVVLLTNVLAQPLITYVLGSQYQPSVVVVRVLIWALPFAFWSYAASILLMAFHHEKVFIVTSIICSVFNVAANLMLVPRFSYMAAAVVTVATELLLVLMNSYFLRTRIGERVVPGNLGRIIVVFLPLLFSVWAVEHFEVQWTIGLIPCLLFMMYAWREGNWQWTSRSVEA